MTTRSWLGNLSARWPRSVGNAPVRQRLAVEALEDRAMLSITYAPTAYYDAGPGVRYTNLKASPLCVAVADVNSDGKPDIITTNQLTGFSREVISNSVSVRLNTGTGTFSEPVNTPVGDFPDHLAVADLNGDGKPDIVTANRDGNSVNVLLNSGTGVFNVSTSYRVATYPQSLTVRDVNGDGKPDITTATSIGGYTKSVLTNTGAGRFSSAATTPSSPPDSSGASPRAAADLNGDGILDLVTPYFSAGLIGVQLSNTAPTITSNLAVVSCTDGSSAMNGGTLGDAQGRNTVTLVASLGTVTKDDASGTWEWTYTPSAGATGATMVTVTATDAGGLSMTTTFTLNVYSRAASEKFVRAAYQNELGRTASAAEVASWVNVLVGPGGQAAVVSGIANSAEARARTVTGWFQTYLGRTADAATITSFVATLRTQTEEQMIGGFLESQEFYNRAQTMGFGGSADQNYVRALYQLVLGRTASGAEVDAQASTIRGGSRKQLALNVLNSVEYRTNVVQSYYANLLHRAASSAEVTSCINTNLDLHTLRLRIECSTEFFTNG